MLLIEAAECALAVNTTEHFILRNYCSEVASVLLSLLYYCLELLSLQCSLMLIPETRVLACLYHNKSVILCFVLSKLQRFSSRLQDKGVSECSCPRAIRTITY